MFRAAFSTVARRTGQRLSQASRLPSAPLQSVSFHASVKREEEAKPAEVEKTSSWEPIYSVPLGIAFAIPAITYEWYLINEETQLAACFMLFTMIVYKNFGGVIQESLEEDGKKLLEEHNKIEDEIIGILEDKLADLKMQDSVVKDAEDIYALKVETYEKLNAAGKIKPLYDFNSQIEKMLTMMEAEEASMQDKIKTSLMAEATSSVMSEFATSKELKKQSLSMAIAQLKGSKTGGDPVKDAYLKFFQTKAKSAAKIDEAAEAAAARESMVSKLNATAMNEGFFFKFGPDGKPTMVA